MGCIREREEFPKHKQRNTETLHWVHLYSSQHFAQICACLFFNQNITKLKQHNNNFNEFQHYLNYPSCRYWCFPSNEKVPQELAGMRLIDYDKDWAACREKIPQSKICPAPCVLRKWTSPLPHSNINVKFCSSHLCTKMLSSLFVHAWAMPHILYLSCGVPFPVWTPENISGLISVVPWLLRWKVIKKNFR